MQTNYQSKRYNAENNSISFPAEEVNKCPLCKKAIKPVKLSMFHLEKCSPYKAHGHFLCTSCERCFVADYNVISNGSNYISTGPYDIGPILFAQAEFDKKINEISPQFVKIYNQALAAESSSLDEIAGLGYRKSLEFLIKDFAIHHNPQDAEAIKLRPLAQCIKNYISFDNIKTLAEKSAWIGNDEAHYIRKQEGRDVSDMKSFIQACVYFISMTLITEDASSMVPK